MSLLEDNMIGALVLLVVGVVALILALLLIKEYLESKKPYHLAWAISFLVLFISGVIIILLGWEEAILDQDLVPPVAALIPAGLAVGLLYAVYDDKQYGLVYAIYSLVVIALITLIKTGILDLNIASMVIMAVHIPSGLIISFVPLYTAYTKETEWTSAFFGIGGLLISFGGVLLAMATVGDGNTDLLDLVFDVLPYLLLVVGVLFVLGIGLPKKWKVEIPVISGLF